MKSIMMNNVQIGMFGLLLGISLNFAFAQGTTNGTVIVTAPAVESSAALITAIATAIVSVSGIVLTIMGRMAHFKNKERIIQIAETVRDGAEITANQEEKFKQFGEAVYEMLPEKSKEIANKEAIKLDNLRVDVEKSSNKLNVINGVLSEVYKS